MLFLLLKSFLLHWSVFQLCLLFRLTSSLFVKKKEQNHRYLKKGGRYVIMRLNNAAAAMYIAAACIAAATCIEAATCIAAAAIYVVRQPQHAAVDGRSSHKIGANRALLCDP